MAKKSYVGVDGVARKIKKGYVGVNDTARKIKKAYIGVGGIARPCWSSGELEYYGTITPLSVGRSQLASTTVGDYALFAGGVGTGSSLSDVVDAYDRLLVRSTPTALTLAGSNLAATTVGNYALFGGGRSSVAIDAYHTSLVRTSSRDLSSQKYDLAATTVGNYALFAGGKKSADTFNPTVYNTVDAYNNNLIQTSTTLSTARYGLSATTVGNYAVFDGGYQKVSFSVFTTKITDAFDTTLTRTTPVNTGDTTRAYSAATTIGTGENSMAMFGGGERYDDGTTRVLPLVYQFNTSLALGTTLVLDIDARYLAATTVGDSGEYALFGGGDSSSQSNNNKVTIFKSGSLVSAPFMLLSNGRSQLASTTIGNYALFGGGYRSSTYCDTVDAFVVS